jgi:hypothetical protein
MERACKAPITSACSLIRACLLLGVATSVGLAACSKALQLRLFNNTKDPITIHLTTLHGFRKEEKNIVIGSHLSAQFDYQSGTLRVSAAGCEITYLLPQDLRGYPFPRASHNIPAVEAQLESDMAIYLVPPDTRTVSNVGLLASLQVQGFPMRPSSRSCPDLEPKT